MKKPQICLDFQLQKKIRFILTSLLCLFSDSTSSRKFKAFSGSQDKKNVIDTEMIIMFVLLLLLKLVEFLVMGLFFNLQNIEM